ncbi:MAG: hypothetical protein U9Q82_10160 [Chloroflexota bacterium]|nr:hypothetical protein [Chloroflexota bacterium]
MKAKNQNILRLRAELLVQRLEHLSADSIWAHRASGVRASLHKALTRGSADTDPDYTNAIIQRGFEILEKAAQELAAPDSDNQS